jgi:adenine phosphoribosyltransferase
MTAESRLRAAIRDVHDFPKPGIVFKDITPVLSDGPLFEECIRLFVEKLAGTGVQKIAGIEARGFIFAAAVAYQMGLGFIPIRKKGKLPWKTQSAAYQLEYGEAVVEVHVDAIAPGEKVAIIDDVLATGGTAAAAIDLMQVCGGEVVAAQFFLELGFLKGREKLGKTRLDTLIVI